MKRDFDLIRTLLLRFDSLRPDAIWIGPMFSDPDSERIWYHVRLMHEAGYLEPDCHVLTDAGLALPMKIYDGRIIIPPGTVISVAMSTAAGQASGLDISARWIEWPF